MKPAKPSRKGADLDALTQACYKRGLMHSTPSNRHILPKRRRVAKRDVIAAAYEEEDA